MNFLCVRVCTAYPVGQGQTMTTAPTHCGKVKADGEAVPSDQRKTAKNTSANVMTLNNLTREGQVLKYVLDAEPVLHQETQANITKQEAVLKATAVRNPLQVMSSILPCPCLLCGGGGGSGGGRGAGDISATLPYIALPQGASPQRDFAQ